MLVGLLLNWFLTSTFRSKGLQTNMHAMRLLHLFFLAYGVRVCVSFECLSLEMGRDFHFFFLNFSHSFLFLIIYSNEIDDHVKHKCIRD